MNLANQITIARILLIPFFVIAIAYYRPDTPFIKVIPSVIFFIASLSDAVDGYLARVRKEQTAFGSFLDPFADKLLLLSAFISLAYSPYFAHKIPAWILIVIVSREILIISGLLIFFFALGGVQIKPSFLGKLTTVVQMVTVGALLLQLNWASLAAYGAALLTIASGLGYVLREVRRV